MIKVIKEGKKIFQTTCYRCGCEFSYELDDLSVGMLMAESVKCPSCNTDVYHPEQHGCVSIPDDFISAEPQSRLQQMTDEQFKEAFEKWFDCYPHAKGKIKRKSPCCNICDPSLDCGKNFLNYLLEKAPLEEKK